MNLLQELEALKKKQLKIEYENKQQNILLQYFGHEIMDYLYKSNNIKKTAKKFGCDIKYLYSKLETWGDCSETLTEREDYNDYHYKFEGRRCELDDFKYSYDFKTKMRTPSQQELDIIFTEYKSGRIKLYELSDKYNLIIINLFRLLKEYKLIEKEADAIGYDEFYKEYIGELYELSYPIASDLELIDIYYEYNNN